MFLRFIAGLALLLFVAIEACAAPTVTTKNLTDPAGTVIPLTSLFTSSPAATTVEFWQSLTTTGGVLKINGVAQPAHTEITISGADISNSTFTVGTAQDSLQIRTNDGAGWSSCDTCAWAPFTVTPSNPPAPPAMYFYDPPAGLHGLGINLNLQCDNADSTEDWATADWANNKGPIQLVKIFGAIGTEFPANTGNAEPIGQYENGVQIYPQGDSSKKLTIFVHAPEVFTTGAGSDWWYSEANYADPGFILQNGDVLHFVSNCFTPYLAPNGFNWQENFEVFWKPAP